MSVSHLPLHQRSLSLDHQALSKIIIEQENILIIQDLDGVCMGLVKDPLTRVIDSTYIEAVKSLGNHFYVLTNGEHIGKRGVNHIVERTFSRSDLVREEGYYLPGLAGGGVQWQDCYGRVSHPGVSEAELTFLAAVPQQIANCFRQWWQREGYELDAKQIEEYIQASVLDNYVTPTANLNVFHELLRDRPDLYASLQQEIQKLMEDLLQQARERGLGDSFFVHYAPNLGRDARGLEIMRPVTGEDSGTTDFQFMLRGGIKEVGVLVILNHYYYLHTGNYPLGEDFNARQAPGEQQALLDLVTANFDPQIMPTIIGVGDTVTSKAIENSHGLEFRRGGSDRGFLELIQVIDREFNRGNVVVYVDSSGGEVKNRKPLKLDYNLSKQPLVVEGPGDSRDTEDPLTLNVVFPEGHQQYIDLFIKAANQRKF